MNKAWKAWLSDRFGWEPIKTSILERRVAKTPWYFGDGATLTLLFGVLVATGMLMTLNYSASPESAYASVQHITNEIFLGWFIRGLHYWSAGTMVVMIALHASRQIILGGYKSPREGTWLIGVLLLFGVLIMSYTGYILRWDERAVYAVRVLLNKLHHVPVIGDYLVLIVQGDSYFGAATLSRFYSVHVVILPMILSGLIVYHLYLVILWGVTSKKERNQPIANADEQKKLYKEQAASSDHGESFYPSTMFNSGTMASIIFLIPLFLTLTVGPTELYPEGNFVATSMPKEEWWFWWYSSLISYIPSRFGPAFLVLFPVTAFIILILLPFIDRSPYRGIKKRLWAPIIVVLLWIAVLYLTDLRRRSPWTGWPEAGLPEVPITVTLTPEAEQGRQLFGEYGCTSCHAVSGQGRRVGSDLARLDHFYSREEARNYILEPPAGVAMPSYRGRVSDEDLERLIDFWLVAQTFEREL